MHGNSFRKSRQTLWRLKSSGMKYNFNHESKAQTLFLIRRHTEKQDYYRKNTKEYDLSAGFGLCTSRVQQFRMAYYVLLVVRGVARFASFIVRWMYSSIQYDRVYMCDQVFMFLEPFKALKYKIKKKVVE